MASSRIVATRGDLCFLAFQTVKHTLPLVAVNMVILVVLDFKSLSVQQYGPNRCINKYMEKNSVPIYHLQGVSFVCLCFLSPF